MMICNLVYKPAISTTCLVLALDIQRYGSTASLRGSQVIRATADILNAHLKHLGHHYTWRAAPHSSRLLYSFICSYIVWI